MIGDEDWARVRLGTRVRSAVRLAPADDVWLSTAYGRDTVYVACHADPRTDYQGWVWGANQRVTVDEAIRISTMHGAYASFEENLKGSITAGKLADFVILDRDIMRVPAELLVDGGDVRVIRARGTFDVPVTLKVEPGSYQPTRVDRETQVGAGVRPREGGRLGPRPRTNPLAHERLWERMYWLLTPGGQSGLASLAFAGGALLMLWRGLTAPASLLGWLGGLGVSALIAGQGSLPAAEWLSPAHLLAAGVLGFAALVVPDLVDGCPDLRGRPAPEGVAHLPDRRVRVGREVLQHHPQPVCPALRRFGAGAIT